MKEKIRSLTAVTESGQEIYITGTGTIDVYSSEIKQDVGTKTVKTRAAIVVMSVEDEVRP